MQFICDERRVYGARYYTVHPVIEEPWNSNPSIWNDMMLWVIEHFGPSESSIWAEDKAPTPGERWYANNAKFWFRYEADMTLFILRWT